MQHEITQVRVPFGGGCVGCGCTGEGDAVGFIDTAFSLAERGYDYFQGKKKAAAAKQKAARTAAFNKQQRLKLEAAQDQTAELRRQIEQERREAQHKQQLADQQRKLQMSIRDQKARADDAVHTASKQAQELRRLKLRMEGAVDQKTAIANEIAQRELAESKPMSTAAKVGLVLGSAAAVGGVVYVVTRKPKDEKPARRAA